MTPIVEPADEVKIQFHWNHNRTARGQSRSSVNALASAKVSADEENTKKLVFGQRLASDDG